MQAHIFAEASNTTADDQDQLIKEYYEGLFSVVASLYEELTALTDAHLRVLSEELGVVDGKENTAVVHENKQTPVGGPNMIEQAKSGLLDAAATADVMVILLSTDVFKDAVADVWDELVDAAKPEAIWCLGAAQSSLENLDFEELEAKGCTVFTYRRVGVARIGAETREELLDAVREKST